MPHPDQVRDHRARERADQPRPNSRVRASSIMVRPRLAATVSHQSPPHRLRHRSQSFSSPCRRSRSTRRPPVRRTHQIICLPTPADRTLGITPRRRPPPEAGTLRGRTGGERWIAGRDRTSSIRRSLPHLNVATVCDTGDARCCPTNCPNWRPWTATAPTATPASSISPAAATAGPGLWAPIVGSRLLLAVDLVPADSITACTRTSPFSSAGSLWSAPPTSTRRIGPRAPATDRRLSSGGTMESSVPYTTVIGTVTRYVLGYRETVFQQRTYGQERVMNLSHRGEVGER